MGLVFFFLETTLGKAVLQYENEGHNTMNMYHTGVPTEYRRQGIAGHLAKVSSYCTLQIYYKFPGEMYQFSGDVSTDSILLLLL